MAVSALHLAFDQAPGSGSANRPTTPLYDPLLLEADEPRRAVRPPAADDHVVQEVDAEDLGGPTVAVNRVLRLTSVNNR